MTVGDPAPAFIALIKKKRPVRSPARANNPRRAQQQGVLLLDYLYPVP